MKSTRRTFVKTLTIGAAGAASLSGATEQASTTFASAWPDDADRVWIGPPFWANRLQDWRLHHGRLECRRDDPAFPMRTVHLLTHRLSSGDGDFEITVRAGAIGDGPIAHDSAVGFLIAAGGQEMDYRAAALVHHNGGPGGGWFAGIDGAGKVFLREFQGKADPPKGGERSKTPASPPPALPADMIIRLVGRRHDDRYRLSLSVRDAANERVLGETGIQIDPRHLAGNVALVSHPGSSKPAVRWWFRDWHLFGAKVEAHGDRTFGPIASTQYTVNRGVVKLTAQLVPIGVGGAQTVELQLFEHNQWKPVATAEMTVPGYTATFRLTDWDAGRDVPYRVVYRLSDAKGEESWHWSGKIRRDPAGKPMLVLAALSCVQQVDGRVDAGKSYGWSNSVWFPHADMLPNLAKHDPDVLFFAGDQIYEGNPTRVVRQPADESLLDYLYKWYLWCWTYRDLTRDRPTITIPDDHDVYQGNVWGAGGKPAREGDPGGLLGGYGMPPEWLNAMQRTQTSHLPDPFDPTAVEQGIGVYYTSLVWGGTGFAILEDRKFKSPPSIVQAKMTPDSHLTEPGYDTRQADVPGATLLGDRQLKFLRAFAENWTGQVMKAALSQTIFCNLQISSRGETAGQLDKDLDSNGWPQTGRRKALEELRRGFVLHIAGDQHLASVVRHGVDDFDDAVWSLCAPAVANLYERFWNPDYPPVNADAELPPYMGRYLDGFHNKITVHAVANPAANPRPGQFPEPVALYRKATGYAIIRFDKPARSATLEVWPRYVDPTDPASGGQYSGWPITVTQTDNYARRATAWLPTLSVKGMAQPVVKIHDEAGELVYALRMTGSEFRPGVFSDGNYRVSVGEPGTSRWRTLQLSTGDRDKTERCVVDLTDAS